MKPLILAVLTCITVVAAVAQSNLQPLRIKGSVFDSVSGKPLAYVTIMLQDARTKTPVKSVISKDDGSFEVSVSKGKNYLLVLAFTGYAGKTIEVKNDNTDFGKIALSPSTKQMKEVTITATRPVMKRQIDGISYDVSADPESPALTALDMMRKVPMISVDASDNIQLKGNSNYKILINGKESALVAKNPSDVLRAMPATNIEKIEVITTPPAKYDAEGLAGIINIITKKKIDEGYNIGVNGRYNTVWGPGINLNGTLKQGKFGMSAYIGMNKRGNQTTNFGNTQNFFADNSLLKQDGANTFNGHNKYGNIELSYEIDSLNLLTGSVEFYKGQNNQNSDQLSSLFDANNIIQQQYRLDNSGYNTWQGLDAAVNYQLGFKKDKNRLLTLSYKYSYSPNKQYNDIILSDTLDYNLPNYRQYNNAGNKEHTVQIDYVHPFKKLTLEAGGKAILRNNFSDFETNIYDDTTKEYVLNTTQSNNFNYHQDIYSLYNSYQYKLDKWTAKAGLRLEHTSISANFVSVGSSVSQDYNNLIPSVSIQRNFDKNSITFGYTDRISRPGIYQLNPFIDQSNPKFINTGNPNLKPELNHTFELNYSNFAKHAVNIGLSYAFSSNSIQNVTSLEKTAGGDTVTLTTYENLGSNSRLGLSVNTNFTIIKDLTVNLNAQGGHVWLKGAYNGQLYTNKGFTGNAFFNAGYKFGKNKAYRVGIDAGIFSGNVNLQGQSSGFIFTSYVVSKTFMNKKATIAFVANNPYSQLFTYHSHTTTPDFYQYSFGQEPYRAFTLRFNFKFGRLNSDIKRNQRGINNDDTKAGKAASSS
ncbi:MAG: TonB-dependent receptor [Bacteroidetes bacterium]|nr:TonB-dependent receptor [Bacteroidota bacterium]